MLTWPSALLSLANQLHLESPWAHLIQLRYRTDVEPDIFGSESVTDHDQDITFNGITFHPYPFKLGTSEHNSASEIRRLTLSTANIDQVVTSLLEQWWVAILDPLWLINLWVVNTGNPALTPINSNDRFTVLSAKTDFLNVTMECQWEGISVRKIVPSRRYVRQGGFPAIPRRVR